MLYDNYNIQKRNDLLTNKYAKLINSGVKPSEILVLVQNSAVKNEFISKILEEVKTTTFEKYNVHSFSSIVYSTLVENWCFIENAIASKKTFILPNLVGLEVSQLLLKDIIKEIEVKGYNSKHSLLHQIFRRYSLIVQNNLSDEDVRERSKILGESFGSDAEKIIKKLVLATLNNRSFDYLRQIPIFNFVYKNTDYFKDIKYLLVDDADEITPACFEFIKFLKPQLKDWLICFDSMGSSRCGYLSADTSIEYKLKKLFNEEITKDVNDVFVQGEIIFSNVLDETRIPLHNFSHVSLSKRAEILENAVLKVTELLKSGVKPREISVITPLQDNMLKFTMKENLKGCKLLFLSGNEKLIDNPFVKASLNILKLMLGISVSEIDLRVILSDYAGIPLKYTNPIIVKFREDKELPHFELEYYNENYQRFINAFDEVKKSDFPLSKKVYEMFRRVVQYIPEERVNKFNFFIKQLRDFEKVFGEDGVKKRAGEIIAQFENSIIAENPSGGIEIGEDVLVVATPQKIIDNKIATKYQIWLDVSSSEWVKTDTGPLYNAWVFQADWKKEEYTLEDDIFLSAQKTARILRKLFLLSKEHTYAYSSLFDPAGTDNFGGIEKYLITDMDGEDNQKPVIKIIPRDDQKPVLDYKSGLMAISAVPGAGKTTILLALIAKLIDRGINPENIFVLTYMESAARTFREKIKNMAPNSTQLPNISTIHGLALRIIKDNANFERLGLEPDFEICDDTQRMRIIKNIQGKNLKRDIEDFDRAISVIKLQQGDINTELTDKKVEKFKQFYNDYQTKLSEANLIDYDDILLLSVRLLEENPDVLNYYQKTCEVIIEDEAQDSSGIQQKLISLLCGKHKNLIRCGDINQAITTTFSNADVDGFRRFIGAADKTVEMNHSQRCAQGIMDLANSTVVWGEKMLPKAFYKTLMKGVENKNPISQNAVTAKIFDKTYEEKNYILKVIKNVLTKDKNTTVGILVRKNSQVAEWTSFVNNAGLKCITRSESLGQKSVFVTIFSILKFLQNPFDNELAGDTYERLAEAGFYKLRQQVEIRNCQTSFITQNCDDVENRDLAQFLWDMQYWLNSSTLPVEELVIRIGLYYYTSEIEKSNVYLIATLVRRLNSDNNYDLTIERLETLSKRPSLSGFKFFSEEEDDSAVKGKVQIMTLHKSKGDEFDLVFIPELTEKSLSTDVSNMTLMPSTMFMEQIRGFNKNYKTKTEDELKEFSAEENMRLFYVAVTRAKKQLFITTSRRIKDFYGKEKEEEPSVLFEELLGKAIPKSSF